LCIHLQPNVAAGATIKGDDWIVMAVKTKVPSTSSDAEKRANTGPIFTHFYCKCCSPHKKSIATVTPL
jgi:hypothetical protein